MSYPYARSHPDATPEQQQGVRRLVAILGTALFVIAGVTLPATTASAAEVSDWASLKAAFASGATDTTVTLTADIVAPGELTTQFNGNGERLDVPIDGQPWTLDLNGHSLTIGPEEGAPDFQTGANESHLPAGEAAVHVPEGADLTITDTTGGGVLTAVGGWSRDASRWDRTGNSGGAGIGGDNAENSGRITITGDPVIKAMGGQRGAGIGGGAGGDATYIHIVSGDVTAMGTAHPIPVGRYGAAGIGGGGISTVEQASSTNLKGGSGGEIIIDGGNINAIGSGSKGGAGIGGGSNSLTSGNITINGGTILAQAEAGEDFDDLIYGATVGQNGAAGIGSGGYSSRNRAITPTTGTITFNGGTVEAYGNGWAAGIGGGSEVSGGEVIVNKVNFVRVMSGNQAPNKSTGAAIGGGKGTLSSTYGDTATSGGTITVAGEPPTANPVFPKGASNDSRYTAGIPATWQQGPTEGMVAWSFTDADAEYPWGYHDAFDGPYQNNAVLSMLVPGKIDPPTITSPDTVSVKPGEVLNVTITTEGEYVELSAADLPEWLKLTDNGDGTATITTADGQPVPANRAGEIPVTITATNPAGSDEQDFTLTVEKPGPPTITSPDTFSVTAGDELNFTITTTGDDVAITAEGLPDWLKLTDNGDGTATITTADGQPVPVDRAGEIPLTITASNLGGSVEQDLALEVAKDAGTPEVTTPDDSGELTGVPAEVVAGQTITPSGSGFLAGSDVQFGYIPQGATEPVWINQKAPVDADGNFTDAPLQVPYDAEAGPITLVAYGLDDAGNVTTLELTAPTEVVTPAAPRITSEPGLDLKAGEVVDFTVTATTPLDGETPAITAENLPEWLTLTDNGDGTATLRSNGPVPADYAGENPFTLVATDSRGPVVAGKQKFTPTVGKDAGTPDAIPADADTGDLTGVPPQVNAGEDITPSGEGFYPGTDVKVGYLPDGADEPIWLDVTIPTDENGDFTNAPITLPNDLPLGQGELIAYGLDDEGNATTRALNAPMDVVPTGTVKFTSSPTVPLKAGEVVDFTITTDNPLAAITAANLPEWLTLTDNGDGTATLRSNGPVPADKAGELPLALTATAPGKEPGTQNLAVAVGKDAGTPDAIPADADTGDLTGVPPQVNAGEDITPSGEGFYPGTDVKVGYLPEGADEPIWLDVTIPTDENGDFTNAPITLPNDLPLGQGELIAYGLDDEGNATTRALNAPMDVVPPDAVKFTSPAAITVAEGNDVDFTITTDDPTAAITAANLPEWLTLTDNGDGTATLTGTPPTGFRGDVPLQLTADNGVVEPTTETLDLTVAHIPVFTSPNALAAKAGAELNFHITTDDPTAVISAEGLPDWLVLVDDGEGGAYLRTADGGPVPVDKAGDVHLNLIADNGVAPVGTQDLALAVENWADRPAALPESDGDLTAPEAAKPGGQVTISGSGYLPGSIVEVGLFPKDGSTARWSTEQFIADENGNISATLSLPDDLALGDYTIITNGLAPDGTPRVLTAPLSITADGTLPETGSGLAPLGLGFAGLLLMAGGALVASRRHSSAS